MQEQLHRRLIAIPPNYAVVEAETLLDQYSGDDLESVYKYLYVENSEICISKQDYRSESLYIRRVDTIYESI